MNKLSVELWLRQERTESCSFFIVKGVKGGAIHCKTLLTFSSKKFHTCGPFDSQVFTDLKK